MAFRGGANLGLYKGGPAKSRLRFYFIVAGVGSILLLWWYIGATKRSLTQLTKNQIDSVQHTWQEQFNSIQSRLDNLENRVGAIDRNIQSQPSGVAQSQTSGTENNAALQKVLFSSDRKLFSVQGQLRSKDPQRIKLRKAKAVIVTGANTSYYGALLNLIGSVHFWDSTRNIIVFDLGLLEDELRNLRSIDRVRVLDSPIKRELKNYAWKSSCLRTATETYGKTIWLDAGSDLRGDPIVIDELLEKEDAFFVQGQDEDMSPWSFPTTLEFFETTKENVKGKYSFSGNLQGYVYDSQAYWEVLMVVEKCSLIRECIAPAGSSLANHRYDQVAMSSAIYTNPTIHIIPHTELLAAGREQISQDHQQPSSHVVYSGRGGSNEYTRYIQKKGIPFSAPTVAEILNDKGA